ncbi:MAG: glycosyltransferase family 2 protein [Duncaniella sp.]|nr:glycosyltransferase family 2 protein [Duncaniella sp.]
MSKVTILLPAFNEAESLPHTYASLRGLMQEMPGCDWELLFVNDGSADDTQRVLMEIRSADPRVNVLSLTRNFGKENAMLAGMDYADGDCLIIMDADGQHDVGVVPRMIAEWEKGFDDVYAVRRDRGKEPWLRKISSLAYYKLLQRITDVDILPNAGDFRLLDRRCVDALCAMRESQRYTKGLYCYIGYRKKAIEFETRDRVAGKSSFSLGRLLKLSLDGITSYTVAPLRLSTMLGLIISFTAFVYMVCVIVKTLAWGEPVRGYPTLITIILFLGGVQLLSLGIVGEYIGRIFIESKRRPPYLADTLNNVKVSPRQYHGS